ncbi:DUF7935 family protein [Crocinitomix catalasitica]
MLIYLFQLATVILPALIIFAAVYYFVNKWGQIQHERNNIAMIQAKSKQPAENKIKHHFFPLQVDAYQRMVLFLERIAPNNLVMRLNKPGLPARALQQEFLQNVRQEYEHNLAQQIFISAEAWSMVQNSKEEVLKIINIAATKLEPDAVGNDLCQAIFELTAQLKNQPTDSAINFLKKELNTSLNG